MDVLAMWDRTCISVAGRALKKSTLLGSLITGR
jgi:hypothetical protein